MKKHIVTMFMVLGLFVAFGASQAQAQVVGAVEADIPFAFHAGSAKFPAGQYTVRMLDNSELKVMEIISADRKHSALFQVMETQAKTDPPKTELIFNRYGDQYFLAEVFDQGMKDGSQVLESHYEKVLQKGGTTPVKHRIPGRHRAKKS